MLNILVVTFYVIFLLCSVAAADPVDLRGKQGVPKDLKNSDPNPPRVQRSEPPPPTIRQDTGGRPVPLADQDRSLWDKELIAEGTAGEGAVLVGRVIADTPAPTT